LFFFLGGISLPAVSWFDLGVGGVFLFLPYFLYFLGRVCVYVCMGLAAHSTAEPTVSQAQVGLGWVGSSLALYSFYRFVLRGGMKDRTLMMDGWRKWGWFGFFLLDCLLLVFTSSGCYSFQYFVVSFLSCLVNVVDFPFVIL